MYRAKILAHSSADHSPALMTVEVEYPRIVLAETVTHRVCRDTFGEFELTASDRTTTEDISKNSASSRAIPITKMVERVLKDPYVPERFSKNGKGMQAAGYWEPGTDEYDDARREWLRARDEMVLATVRMGTIGGDVGVHKQETNRLLEPWMWVTQILTADDLGWHNFFALRCDKHAHPAFQKIARMVYLQYRKSTPERLEYGQWHLPFIAHQDREGFVYKPDGDYPDYLHQPLPDLIQFSAARCAWVSYENHDRDGTPEQMRSTYNRLMAADPKHASPVEHQATPMDRSLFDRWPSLRSNLRGWVQARKLVLGERTDKYAPSDAEVASWGLGD